MGMLSAVLGFTFIVSGLGADTYEEALNLYRSTFHGDGTYYGDAGGGGTCSYGVQNPPVARQVKYPVALNRPQFLNSVMCGTCWKVSASGHGLGNNPIRGEFLVFVDDLCPGCQAGDLDFGVDGDGRWDITIQAVQCPVGSGNVQFKFQGSNPWYLKLQVQNSRLAVHKMEIDHNGWQPMKHTSDGFFVFNSGPVNGSFRVRLTAVNGAQIIDTIPRVESDSVFPGQNQFPLDTSLPHA
ncbi:uncharacterized protein LOC112554082 isoform X2 [Pomacea canaliculata]|uniref:uncharacterized protein LOC112554082 isoform X2 n=1 Tax=Pomacea canaliculata TaxID=400727 RepID=UPI000D72873F|nr:uncharacterized protein LOC112554082 isoform X2 [Pomacea canaliculata]